MTIQVLKDFTCPLQGNIILLVEIHHLRFDLLSVLPWLVYAGRELAVAGMMADWTILELSPMFRDFNLHGRHI